MPSLRTYWYPSNPHWHTGNAIQRFGPSTLLPITLFIIVAWALFIADQLNSRWVWQYRPLGNPRLSWTGPNANAMSYFYLRAFVVMIPDTIHLPIHHYILHHRPHLLHPIYSLVASTMLCILWFTSGILDFTVAMPGPYVYIEDDHYDALVTSGGAFQILIAVCYAVYMGFSAVAVHRWRLGSKHGCDSPTSFQTAPSTREVEGGEVVQGHLRVEGDLRIEGDLIVEGDIRVNGNVLGQRGVVGGRDEENLSELPGYMSRYGSYRRSTAEWTLADEKGPAEFDGKSFGSEKEK